MTREQPLPATVVPATLVPATARPPRYKQALVTWLGVYPALTLTLFVLGPAMESWPLPLRTLLVSVVMVIALMWLILPLLMRLFRTWMLR
jgi:antibiotic biosynthesis monooxygenase (ABM) superfamily enzyme